MIELIIDKRTRDLGGGFEVGRVLPFAKRRMVGPFIFFDQMGPVDFAPGIPRELDVRPHPHIGLSTVTYLYSGAMTHRDSLGFKQEIQPGAVNWMTSGKGITHSERLEYARMNGAHMHGIQAWVALPKEDEEIDPGFWHHPADTLPVWNEAGLKGRLIAGKAEGLDARVNTRSPMFYMHWDMEKGTRRKVPDEYPERAVYVASGSADVAGQKIGAGQMAVLGKGDVVVTADEASTVMVLGGEPVGERFIFWNFVSSSKERLEQAKEDWKQGRMKLPDGDEQEFTPLPEG
ncbi:pirin family protein [Hyphomonas sp. NPDC076900]|uniref:pirin family protein n=1 Tax=unclassified Hyphomonas TaxID=2630699 RepID=UPI003D07DD71